MVSQRQTGRRQSWELMYLVLERFLKDVDASHLAIEAGGAREVKVRRAYLHVRANPRIGSPLHAWVFTDGVVDLRQESTSAHGAT